MGIDARHVVSDLSFTRLRGLMAGEEASSCAGGENAHRGRKGDPGNVEPEPARPRRGQTLRRIYAGPDRCSKPGTWLGRSRPAPTQQSAEMFILKI